MKKNWLTVIIGLLIIVGGILYGCNVLGYWDTNLSFDGWWALFIILPCVLSMCTGGINLLNSIGAGVGVLLLLSAQGVFRDNLGYKLIAPLIVILLGMNIVFKVPVRMHKEGNNGIFAGSRGDTHFAVFGGNKPKFDDVVFRGVNTYAIFGGIELMLKNSTIKRDCTVNVYSFFGNTDITLPENVRAYVTSTPIIGSIQNTFKSSTIQNAPTVYIHVLTVFGSADIR